MKRMLGIACWILVGLLAVHVVTVAKKIVADGTTAWSLLKRPVQ